MTPKTKKSLLKIINDGFVVSSSFVRDGMMFVSSSLFSLEPMMVSTLDSNSKAEKSEMPTQKLLGGGIAPIVVVLWTNQQYLQRAIVALYHCKGWSFS